MKVLFFIGTLSLGGAERQLTVLAKGLAARGHSVSVATMYPGGKLENDIRDNPNIKLISLYPKRCSNPVLRLLQLLFAHIVLRRTVKNVDCLYSMLEVANLIAWLATRGIKSCKLVWGIRSSNMEGHWKMALSDKLCVFVSPTVGLLIANSNAGLDCLIDRGYRPKRHEVVLNGIDTEKFRFHEGERKRVRDEINVTSVQLVVGIVARLDSMKDHQNFLKAASLVLNKVGNVKFLCVGDGPVEYASKLHLLANEYGLKGHIHWLGDRTDMAALYSAMDLLVSSSCSGEGFPNVVAEAMSCGVPCVVTDVGDSATIVGDKARVVEARKPVDLARVICESLKKSPDANGRTITSNRIKENFSLKRLIDLTEVILNRISFVN
jgi:glycosyltransferase involved in cell wall biosynthesis